MCISVGARRSDGCARANNNIAQVIAAKLVSHFYESTINPIRLKLCIGIAITMQRRMANDIIAAHPATTLFTFLRGGGSS